MSTAASLRIAPEVEYEVWYIDPEDPKNNYLAVHGLPDKKAAFALFDKTGINNPAFAVLKVTIQRKVVER